MPLGVPYSKIQRELDKRGKLYLSNFKSEYSFQNMEMEEFILSFLKTFCKTNNTIRSGDDTIETLSPSLRRSIGDIYRLCSYYYDNVTVFEVQYWLARLVAKNKINYFYCNATKSRVYMDYNFHKTHTINPIKYACPDEWGIPKSEVDTLGLNKKLEKSFNLDLT